jgi:hypothetical protein
MTRNMGWTQKFEVGGMKGYLRVSVNEDGTLHGFQVDLMREGSLGKAMFNAFAAAVNIGLQGGVPLKSYVDMFKDWTFEPKGEVKHSAAVSEAKSILDYIMAELEIAFLLPTFKEE